MEYVLRFVAFQHRSYLNYLPPMRRFLNEEMRDRLEWGGKQGGVWDARRPEGLTAARLAELAKPSLRLLRGVDSASEPEEGAAGMAEGVRASSAEPPSDPPSN